MWDKKTFLRAFPTEEHTVVEILNDFLTVLGFEL
jgi:hypothetical protein